MQILEEGVGTLSAQQIPHDTYPLNPSSEVKTFWFHRARRVRGLTSAIVSCVCFASAAFLVSQLPSLSLLAAEFIGAAIILALLGLYLAHRANCQLFGRVSVSRHGVSIQPSLASSFIPWGEVSSWELRETTQPVLLWMRVRRGDSSESLCLTSEWLPVEDLKQLESIFRHHAVHCERRN